MTVKPRIYGHREAGGATTMYSVIFTIVLFVVVGLIVDGGAMLTAHQEADSIARQAARTAGQQVSLDPNRHVTSTGRGVTAGEDYATAHGCETASVHIDGTTITATCSLRYDLIFLPGSYLATRTATADSQTVVGPP